MDNKVNINININIDIEVEIEEGEFVTLSTQPTVVDIRHSIHSTQPAVVGYTLQPAVVGGGGWGFSRISTNEPLPLCLC